MRRFLSLFVLFAAGTLLAAEQDRTDVYAELTHCGTEQEMFGVVEKFQLKLSDGFPLENTELVILWRRDRSVSENRLPLLAAGKVFRLGHSVFSGRVAEKGESIVQIAFGAGSRIVGTYCEGRDGKLPQWSFQNRVVLYPGQLTALEEWSLRDPAQSAVRIRFSPWEKTPQTGLFLKLVIPESVLSKVKGTPYRVVQRREALERFGFPSEKVRDEWDLAELDRSIAAYENCRLRWNAGVETLSVLLDRELAVIRVLLRQPGVAESPQAADLHLGYLKRLQTQLEMFRAAYQAGTSSLDPVRRKEREIAEYRKKWGLQDAVL